MTFIRQYISLVYHLVKGTSVHFFAAVRAVYDFVWVTHSSKFLMLTVQLLLLLCFAIDFAYPLFKRNFFLLDDLLHFLSKANRIVSDHITCGTASSPSPPPQRRFFT